MSDDGTKLYVNALHSKMDRYGIPSHMQDALIRYIVHHIKPGSFLTSFLSNDLMGALANADDENLHLFPAYGKFLYNTSGAREWYGSEEVVQKHLEKRST